MSVNTGHGIIGTTRAEDTEKLANHVIEQGLSDHLLAEINLVVFPKLVDGDRYVGRVVELVPRSPLRNSPTNSLRTRPNRLDSIITPIHTLRLSE